MNESLAVEHGQIDQDLRAIIDVAPEAVFLAWRSGELIHANEAACALSGYAPSALLKQPLDRMLALTWPAEEAEAINPVWQRGRREAVPTWLRRADGTWVAVEASALLLPGGKVQVWIRDVSGHRSREDHAMETIRSEHALGVNERLLKTIFDLLPVGVWLADRRGRIVGNNPAAERIWKGARYVDIPGYGEYKGWRVETGEPIAPEDWGMARAITQGQTVTGELVRIQCFDGSFKTIIYSAAPLLGEQGEITGGIVVNEDITRLHEAQERQRDSEDLLRLVFDLLPVALWVADRDGTITFTNVAADHICNGVEYAGPESGDALKAWSVETGEPIADEEWALARALRGETSRSELIRIECRDGSTKTLMMWAAAIRSGDGEVIGAIAASEDVTPLQYTQDQLRSAVRERERILAVVAHDLRNPLAALMAHASTAQLAASRLPGGEKVVAQAASIKDITKRASGLVNDLLSVGAAGTGGHPMLDFAAVSPASLLARAADAAQPLLAGKELALEIKSANDLPEFDGDANRILRVLGNLLENAVKFTAPAGRVTVVAEATDAGVLFSVANSGAPVDAAELEHMFQPFWQARSDAGGTGLGLAICRSIVEAHGGRIWAEPAEGQRLKVRFVLPWSHRDTSTGPRRSAVNFA
mgnify:CR=1 FL=1|jgi:PAS domain S-box-containing protein